MRLVGDAGEGGGESDVQEVRLHGNAHGRRRGGFWKQLLVEARVRQPALRIQARGKRLCNVIPIEGGGNFGGSSNQAFFEVRSAWTQAQAESSTISITFIAPPPHTHIYRPRFIGYIKKFSILSSELPLIYAAVERVCYVAMP